MPQYCYKCGNCEHEFETWHSMKERLDDCPECESVKSLYRVPYFTINRKIDKAVKVGSVVKKSIEEAKKEIEEDKKKARKEDYES